MRRHLLESWLIVALLLLTATSTSMAKSPRVHITGPPKERAQFVGQPFTIGVAADGFHDGWVEIQSPSDCQCLPLERSATNYLDYTPQACGEYKITAVVMQAGSDAQWKSTVTITVYPVDAKERACWMVRTALASVGSTDVDAFVSHTSLSATDDWCAAFIGWCARQNHIPFSAGLEATSAGVDIYAGQTDPISCRKCARIHQSRFLATVLAKDEPPEPGDLVFFIWGSKAARQAKDHPGYQEQWHGNASHVGLVTSVTADGFQFVQGNIRMKRNRFGVALNSSTDEKEGKTYADWVVAFGRPHYDEQALR